MDMENKNQLGVFDDVREAIQAAYDAQRVLMQDYTTEDRDRFIAKIKENFLKIIDEETTKEFVETGYGRLADKLMKNRGSIIEAAGTEALQPHAMASSKGLTVEYRAPYGLVAALTPVTNGLPTVACNTIAMIAAGNSIVFNAHPAGKLAAAKAVDLLNRSVIEAGGPANLATMPRTPNTVTLKEMMESPLVSLLIGTGGENMVELLMSSKKKVIAAGPGNVPVIIDETADVKAAAQTLMQNVPVENTMLCITEKEAFVVEDVYDEFLAEMQRLGARLLTPEEAQKVAAVAVHQESSGKWMPEKKFVGRDPNVILEAAGVTPSDFDLRLAIIEADMDCPFVPCEQLMPIFPIVKVKDFAEAERLAVETEHGYHHSAAIWTGSLERATHFGKLINTTCFAMNGATVAACGMGGTGTGSVTIATGTGEGFTTPASFTRVRRFAMGNGSGYVV